MVDAPGPRGKVRIRKPARSETARIRLLRGKALARGSDRDAPARLASSRTYRARANARGEKGYHPARLDPAGWRPHAGSLALARRLSTFCQPDCKAYSRCS